MLNLHISLSVENFRDNDKPIDKNAVRAKIVDALRQLGYSADGAIIGSWSEQPLPPETKPAE